MRFKRYANYKDSGVELLGEIPEHWNVVRLKYAASINDETLSENTNPDFEFMYVDIGSVDSVKGIQEKEFMRFETSPSRARRIVSEGDVIVSTVRTYLRAIAPIEEADSNLIVSTGFAVMRPKNILKSKFAAYALRAPYFVDCVVANSVGVSYPAINENVIGGLFIAIPSLEEQFAISYFLEHETEKIDALIEKKERLIELLQEKRNALITHAVTKGLPAAAAAQAGLDPNVPMKDSGVEWIGEIPEHWKVIKIKRLCLVKRGASPRPIDDPIYFDDEGAYSWVRIADVTASEKYLMQTQQKLSELGKSKSVPLEPGEIFLSIAATVGKPIITKIRCCIHDGFVYFDGLKENIEFLYYVFSCGEAYKGLGKLGTQLNLNTDTIGDIYIPLPGKKEQEKIVEYLDNKTAKIDRLIVKIKEAIDGLKEYRSALISAAVTGKIDVREEAA